MVTWARTNNNRSKQYFSKNHDQNKISKCICQNNRAYRYSILISKTGIYIFLQKPVMDPRWWNSNVSSVTCHKRSQQYYHYTLNNTRFQLKRCYIEEDDAIIMILIPLINNIIPRKQRHELSLGLSLSLWLEYR